VNIFCNYPNICKQRGRWKWREDGEEDVRSYWMTLKDRRGYSHLKEEALDRTMWRHRFGGGFGPVVRQIAE